MANTFQITISAVDKATAVVRKVNDSMSRITRPFNQVGKSFKSLGREIGVDKIGAELQKIGQTARDAARGVGSIVAPMAAISGVASVGGIIALADSWGKLGRSITYSAQNIGMSTTSLQEWQGAARAAGFSSDSITQSMSSLAKTMEDAFAGRNQQAMMEFGRVGIPLKQTANGLWDVSGAMEHIADYIASKKNPQAQAIILSTLGISPELLPMLRNGAKGIRKYREELLKQGLIMSPAQIASANEFAKSLSRMDISMDVMKNSIGNALVPAIQPLIDQFDQWATANKTIIAQNIGEYVRDFAKWLKTVDWKKIGSEIHTALRDIGKVVDALGGVKGLLMEIAAYKTLSLFGNVAVSVLRIGALTKAMFGLRDAAKEAAAAEAAAAAGGATPSGVTPAAGAAGGILSKFLGAGGWLGILKTAMWAPRPSDAGIKAVQDATTRAANDHESYWQKWADVFHWRTSTPVAPMALPPMAKPKARSKGRADDNIDLFGNSKLPRGIRNNNPGNIIYGNFARNMGAIGADAGGFAIFPSAQKGMDAIGANLRSYGKQGFDTPFEIAHRWSTTDQDAYTRRLAGLFGGDPNKQLNMGDPKVISALRDGIITQENGSNPYAAPVGPYSRAASAVPAASGKLHLDVQVSAPVGTKVKASSDDDSVASIRVSHRSVGAMA